MIYYYRQHEKHLIEIVSYHNSVWIYQNAAKTFYVNSPNVEFEDTR